MKCTACNAPMIYKGGENKEDFGCKNIYCCARVEADYGSHLTIKENWYFCGGYHLPFKSGNKWFCVIGPKYLCINGVFSERTFLQEIIVKNLYSLYYMFNYSANIRSSQTTLLSIKYMALPANNDFEEQFKILIEKVIGRLAIK